MAKRAYSTQQVAETVAIQALSFIAGEPVRLGQFLAETGIGPETLRSAASEPAFLASVLDFIMRHDAMVKDFAASVGLPPDTIATARQAMDGDRWERDVP